ncbi:MAG: RodZ domain-containing protein [Cyanobium sp.]
MAESPDPEGLKHEALRQELEAVQRRRDSYQNLLKDLPEIFEGKFRERLRPLQQHNEQLQLEGLALREQIRRALPDASAAPSQPTTTPLTPSAPQAAATPPSSLQGEAVPPPINALPSPTHFADGPEAAGSEPAAQEVTEESACARRSWWAQAFAEVRGRQAWLLRGGLLLVLLMAALSQAQRLLPVGDPGAGRAGGGSSRPAKAPTVSPARAERETPRSAQHRTAASLRIKASQPVWVEVEAMDGRSLLYSLFQGERSFPLGQGLRIRAGRPDLIRVQRNGAEARTLGDVNDLGWHAYPMTAN